ncbi:hypothetical protein CC1G_04872 [Coprinopsis cinerea okayama7|uniref:DUF6593 domain-containing protein n=1 Tax=Coprinopsis cinerea (strain Okayama-7 / 130 / ATCC MYA-4618 / FGSC 9003) TaxID=240176 RepID=A8PFW0_COPC7|nr:hypothetical protein CC1G_04872 [Coprinopsis cinerea okayama7\|eukprot:XP_001841028.1 hypothetical protein CC1G_04872 [Coprinopsis cinerea okayama7\
MADSTFDPSASRLSFESTETLIDASPLILKFNRRSVTNATIYSHTFPVYRISTNKDGTKTDVYDTLGNETRIATIKRREFLPDVIKYRNRGNGTAANDVVKINNWLKYEKLEGGLTGVSFDSTCGQLTWRYGQLERYRLALYKSKDFSNPIAYLDLSEPGIPILLRISPGYQYLVEDILMSALILEYKLKMFERLKKHDLLYGPILGSLVSFR